MGWPDRWASILGVLSVMKPFAEVFIARFGVLGRLIPDCYDYDYTLK